jgi:hypothetical protein
MGSLFGELCSESGFSIDNQLQLPLDSANLYLMNSIRKILVPLAFLLTLDVTFGEETISVDGLRKWTEKETGRVILGRIEGKRNQGSEIRILLKNSKSIWLQSKILSAEDQAFATKWEKRNVKLTAQTMSVSTKREKWVQTWTAESRDKAAFLSIAGKDQWSDRTLGITLDNRGTEIDVVVDVFWFGFPLNDKNQRFVNGRATKIYRLPPEDTIVIPCEGGCVYKERSLAYLEADFRKLEIAGLFVKGWSGYTYAGWAVRVSTLDGGLLGGQGAQPTFLNRISNVPIPIATKKEIP